MVATSKILNKWSLARTLPHIQKKCSSLDTMYAVLSYRTLQAACLHQASVLSCFLQHRITSLELMSYARVWTDGILPWQQLTLGKML